MLESAPRGRGFAAAEERLDVEYRYRHEQQARFFAAVFAMGPEWIPMPVVVREPKRKKAQPRSAEPAIDAELDALIPWETPLPALPPCAPAAS